jgi:hypothetical protein
MPKPSFNPAGRGGPVAAQARLVRESGLCRLAALMCNGRGTDDMAKIKAARELLSAPRRAVSEATRLKALDVMREMIADDATTDAATVEAVRLAGEVGTHGRRAG